MLLLVSPAVASVAVVGLLLCCCGGAPAIAAVLGLLLLLMLMEAFDVTGVLFLCACTCEKNLIMHRTVGLPL